MYPGRLSHTLVILEYENCPVHSGCRVRVRGGAAQADGGVAQPPLRDRPCGIRRQAQGPQDDRTPQRRVRGSRRHAGRGDTPDPAALAHTGHVVVERGEIWWADIGEASGSGPGFRRPVLVVQSDAFNRSRIRTIAGVVITSNMRLVDAPGNVLLPKKASGLSRDAIA